jgi:dihydroorotate dehydrogenase
VNGTNKRRNNPGTLRAYAALYERLVRPIVFRKTPQEAHESVMRWLRWADERAWLQSLLGHLNGVCRTEWATQVGGGVLDCPLILAAGFVKGDGFDSEAEALAAVESGANIIPGWRSVPQLVDLVEFGSFTRWPRQGNPGVVMWRDEPSRSTQNRVGLKNPGATAAAEFLSSRRQALPRQFGINIAVSPGVGDPEQERGEILESIAAFLAGGVYPTWLTLNLSCPNTEDDPGERQTEAQARDLCGAVLGCLRESGQAIPLWVKVGPTLADEPYRVLMRVFHEVGVSAVIATNTLPKPAPGNPEVVAGVGGGELHQKAVEVAALLMQEKTRQGYKVDVVGCGGVEDGASYQDFARLGVSAVQYWTVLVYRGPLAPALVANEALS